MSLFDLAGYSSYTANLTQLRQDSKKTNLHSGHEFSGLLNNSSAVTDEFLHSRYFLKATDWNNFPADSIQTPIRAKAVYEYLY